jgi:hypothetical protein
MAESYSTQDITLMNNHMDFHEQEIYKIAKKKVQDSGDRATDANVYEKIRELLNKGYNKEYYSNLYTRAKDKEKIKKSPDTSTKNNDFLKQSQQQSCTANNKSNKSPQPSKKQRPPKLPDIKAKPVYDKKEAKPVPSEISTGVKDLSPFTFDPDDSYTEMVEKVNYIKKIIKNKRVNQKKEILQYYDIPVKLENRSNTQYWYGSKNLKNKMYRFYVGSSKRF